MNTVLEFLAKFIINILPGNKTKILGIIGILVSVWTWIVEKGILADICLKFGWCIEGTKFHGWVSAIFAFLMMVTYKAAEMKHKAELKAAKKEVKE